MGMIHRVWGNVSEEVFYKMLQRAREEQVYVDDKGLVDIGALIAKLVETYGDGEYTILPPSMTHGQFTKHAERFDALAEMKKDAPEEISGAEGDAAPVEEIPPKKNKKKAKIGE